MFGENSRKAISTLRDCYKRHIELALQPNAGYAGTLRLDPFWDPLRADPAFQKLCEERP
jgi:hypothetical protein